MSAHSTNVIQSNTEDFRPILRPVYHILRPVYHILRPGNRLVPLIAGDELPCWLKVVGSWCLDVTNIITVNKDNPYPRRGEYDIICQYCIDATNQIQMYDETRNDANREDQGRDALRKRAYAPTGHNQYVQRVPVTSELSVQHLVQPTPVRPSQPQFLLPAQFFRPIQTTQPAQPGAINLPPIQPTHSKATSTSPIPLLSLPSMPSLPSQPSGINRAALLQPPQHTMQPHSLIQPSQTQQQQQQQPHYQYQQIPFSHQPPQHKQNWWQERGRTRDRNQVHYHPWDCKSPPGQPRRRLPPSEPQRQLRSASPISKGSVRQSNHSRGLNATAPAFVPSTTPLAAPPPPPAAAAAVIKE